jgi:hypothetical protein
MGGTIAAVLNILSGGVDIVKGWMGMQKTASDQQAGANVATVAQQGKALQEVKDAKDAESAVDAAGGAAADSLRGKWTKGS